MPTPQIQNVAGVWGTSALTGYNGTDRNTVVQEFIAATTTTAGNLVALSTSAGYVINCLTDTTASLVIGVAQESAAANDVVPVVIHGPAYGVKKATSAVTAGNYVRRDVTVTASAVAITPGLAVTTYADLVTIGIVLANQTAGDATCGIYVNKV